MCDKNKRNFIQNKEAHVFMYHNKEYPFKIDYFKYVSTNIDKSITQLEKASNQNNSNASNQNKSLSKNINEDFYEGFNG